MYGWAALQYQAWARGFLKLAFDSTQCITFYTDNVLEFWIDRKQYFGGDFYAYRRAPLVLHLQPGNHQIDIRLLRDVRAMGGIGEPKLEIKLQAKVSDGGLAVTEEKLLVSDIVNQKLAGPFGSLPVRNEGLTWVDIYKVESPIVCSEH